MADDNSCLFTALSGALAPGVKDPAPYLRNQIAEYILSHSETYNKVTLEKPPEQYVRNLRGKDFWGGSIEISVLSDIYDIQIVAVDVKVKNKNKKKLANPRRSLFWPLAHIFFVTETTTATTP
jgi:ubiquitin thioesterase OTU1